VLDNGDLKNADRVCCPEAAAHFFSFFKLQTLVNNDTETRESATLYVIFYASLTTEPQVPHTADTKIWACRFLWQYDNRRFSQACFLGNSPHPEIANSPGNFLRAAIS